MTIWSICGKKIQCATTWKFYVVLKKTKTGKDKNTIEPHWQLQRPSLPPNAWTHTCCSCLGPTICLWGSWLCEWCLLCLHSSQAGRSCELSWSAPPWRGTWVPLHPSPGIKSKLWEDYYDSLMKLLAFNLLSHFKLLYSYHREVFENDYMHLADFEV